MTFDLTRSIQILERTPTVLETLLSGLDEAWTMENEGENTWSPFDVVGHLIHGERTDWIPRARIILAEEGDKKFEPFDRFAQYEASRGKSMKELLETFEELRQNNLNTLRSLPVMENLSKEGIHPEFGKVTLEELLSTWVTHDLNHIGQIVRAMAHQYKNEVGPWKAYMGILNQK